MSLKPFWSYYGGKWRVISKYPPPTSDEICEPFAGAAGYSCRYSYLQVTLYDKDPTVAGLWSYLIRVLPSEILSLPVGISHVDDIKGPQEAKWLIGWWMNKGTAGPRKQPSSQMKDGLRPKSHWGPEIRSRIARQVKKIRHWKMINSSYENAPDSKVTWFIDPPYSGDPGRYYKYNKIDFVALADWCKSRRGQVIVCENYGADWLPFRPLSKIKGGIDRNGRERVSKEVIWTNHRIGFGLNVRVGMED